MEEQTLHYYLKVFSAFFTISSFLFFIYIFNILNKNLNYKENKLTIEKNQKLESIITDNFLNLNSLDVHIYKLYYKIINITQNKFIHYGDFILENKISFIKLLDIISKPGNFLNRITIIEGWSQNQLNIELSNHFKEFYPIPYEDIIADTYFFEKNKEFKFFHELLKENKNTYMSKFKKNKVFKRFSENEIFIIGSLLEKEGLDIEDKKKISSVIFNRLEKKMKLQIDATVIYSITNGKYNLNRKLFLNDLKFDHPFNTYLYKGLPPKPISYVGRKTLDIVLANNKSDFLFYFFDNSLNRHIFSKTFEKHKEKLNEYRTKN